MRESAELVDIYGGDVNYTVQTLETDNSCDNYDGNFQGNLTSEDEHFDAY